MKKPHELQGLSLKAIVQVYLAEVMQTEERVNTVRERRRVRLSQTMPKADNTTLDREVNKDYWVMGAIADNQWARDKVKTYAAAALVLGNDYVPWI